jgi:multiple sugar transport system permease protein
MSDRASRTVLALSVIGVILFCLLPLLLFLMTSFKTPVEITRVPPDWTPSGGLSAYRTALTTAGLGRAIGNSAIIALATTLANTLLAVLAAFALARLKIRYRWVILGGVLAISMFPQISLAGPIWRLLQLTGLLNTYPGLILPYVSLTLPLSIWLLTVLFAEIPGELEEAAAVDGCGPMRTLLHITLPLAAPAVVTAALLTFIYAWNEFFFSLLILSRPELHTMPVAIALFQGQYTVPWAEIAAASAFATLPLLVLVLLFQHRIVRGLTAGALKG